MATSLQIRNVTLFHERNNASYVLVKDSYDIWIKFNDTALHQTRLRVFLIISVTSVWFHRYLYLDGNSQEEP